MRRLPATIGRDQVLHVVRSNASTVRSCQENYGSSVRRVILGWKIYGRGRAGNITVRPSSQTGTPFGKCLRRALSRWRFPRFSGAPVEISAFPFSFD